MRSFTENSEHTIVELEKTPLLVRIGLFSQQPTICYDLKDVLLTDLPTDIFTLITKYLDVKSLLALSKTCTFIQSKVCDDINNARILPIKNLVTSRPESTALNVAATVYGTFVVIGFVTGILLGGYYAYQSLNGTDPFEQISLTIFLGLLGGIGGTVGGAIPGAIIVGIFNYYKNNTFIAMNSIEQYMSIGREIKAQLLADESNLLADNNEEQSNDAPVISIQ